MELVFDGRTKNWKSLDYVAGWFMKAADYGTQTNAAAAFVATNSICQGRAGADAVAAVFSSRASRSSSRTHPSNGRTLRATMPASPS